MVSIYYHLYGFFLNIHSFIHSFIHYYTSLCLQRRIAELPLSDAIEIRDGITFDFYTGLSHIHFFFPLGVYFCKIDDYSLRMDLISAS